VPEPESEEEESRAEESITSESDDELRPEAASAPVEASETEEGSEAEEQPVETTEGSGERSERSFTLREPHSRPHFAPRRGRRGRRRAGRHSRRNGSRERESSRAGGQQGLQISELLKEGQEIIVQIAKEPLGTKGARITSHVALPGRYVVYMPTITHVGVSRKIASEQERLRLRNIVMEYRGTLTGGFIVRTAGEGRSDEEIKADLNFLTNLWNDIRTRAEQVKAPALLYRDLDLAQRLMRDLVTPDFKSIWLDSEADYERVVEFINRLQPSLVGCAKLHTRLASLFEEHGIEDEIAKALKPKVWLKSGGYIVINQTEALVAIDVNTGKYVGKTNRLEDTIVKTNIDAVNEIVRQIRLRDLGGIIVIDFIDMDERRNRNKVVQALEEALRRDRAPTKVLSFNDFGLVAVTRKRVKQSLERTLCDPCTYCNGSGWVKSVNTVTYEILAEARKMAEEIEGKTMTLRVNPEVAQELKSKDGTLIREIEALTHKNLVIKSDPAIHQERFEIF
jgi:Rne/Rng family ribonuclease